MQIAGSFLTIQDDKDKILSLVDTVDLLHFDVMDGVFTEKKTLPFNKLLFLKNINKAIDIHLMVKDIKKYIDDVVSFNPKYITFHLEASSNPNDIIDYIHKYNIKAGIAINPNTDLELIYPYLNKIDLVLIMSVEAGKGGQKFIDITNKINELITYKHQHNSSFLIEVDGGINDETIKKVKNVDIAVSGSFITNSDNYNIQVQKLKSNGFTLAELLGVIVILSILGLIAVVAVDSSIKNSHYNTCLVQSKNLTEGAKMLTIDYPSILPAKGSTLDIPVSTLENGGKINGVTVNGGYIESGLINPMTNKAYTASTTGVSVHITNQNGNDYDYQVVFTNTKESCHK
jgi:ribulose-phosphate 3-epimerase